MALARPTAWIIGKFPSSSASPSIVVTAAPNAPASARAAASSSAGPMSLVGGVDQVAGQRHAAASACASAPSTSPGGTKRSRPPPPRPCAGAVAIEAIAAEKHGQDRERSVEISAVRKLPVARRQMGRQRTGGERAAPGCALARSSGLAEAENGTGGRTVCIGHEQHLPAPASNRVALAQRRAGSGRVVETAAGRRPDRQGGRGIVAGKDDRHGACPEVCVQRPALTDH